MARRMRALRYRMDGSTIVVMLLAMFVLNVLLFSAGWLLGVARTQQLPAERIAAAVPRPERKSTVRQLAAKSVQAARAFETAAARPFVIPRWAGPPQEQGPPAPPPMLVASGETAPRYAPRNYAALIEDAAYRESVPSYLVAAVARVESNFDARAISDKGALGLMQVMPETARRFGFDAARLHDPVHNVAAGATYLRWLLERYDGDLDRVLAAYNAGEGAVDKYKGIPPYRETQDFVKRVRAVMEKNGVRTGTTA
ncbi:MAG: lytic transglycosylase domain-containing protein [Acidobacteriota bacterium]